MRRRWYKKAKKGGRLDFSKIEHDGMDEWLSRYYRTMSMVRMIDTHTREFLGLQKHKCIIVLKLPIEKELNQKKPLLLHFSVMI